jgi:hypothetical protein
MARGIHITMNAPTTKAEMRGVMRFMGSVALRPVKEK